MAFTFEKGRWYSLDGGISFVLCVKTDHNSILRGSRKYTCILADGRIILNRNINNAAYKLTDFEFFTLPDGKLVWELNDEDLYLETSYGIKDEIDSILRLTYESIINHLRNKENGCK